ncbi:MAG TPA: UbiA family prenyltransferase [candidate division Zixibacteria bacterium]|nr:UbiA family prenyltransferase [candidate division Zixibacteria bacterium]
MKVFDYIFAARPMLLLPVWSIYLTALHYHNELIEGTFTFDNLAVMAGLTLLIAAAYYINQIYDRSTDLANQKVLFLQNQLVKANTLLKLFIILSIVPIGISVLYSKVVFFIYLQLFGLGYLYSAPPFRLKDRAISGLLVNAYAFGFLISISIMPNISPHNAGLLGWDNPFYFFLSVMGVHILTTLPDAPGDKATGKRTIGVIFPKRMAVLLSLFAFIGATLVAYKSGFKILARISTVSALVTFACVIISSGRLVLAAAKLPILFLTLLSGYFYPYYLLFVVVLVLATRSYYKRRFNIIYPKLV